MSDTLIAVCAVVLVCLLAGIALGLGFEFGRALIRSAIHARKTRAISRAPIHPGNYLGRFEVVSRPSQWPRNDHPNRQY